MATRTGMRKRLPIGAVLLGLALGVGLGLLAGWRLWPVQYDSVTPDLLADAYQLDYANMIAVAYDDAPNLDLARARLARLGPAAADLLARLAADEPAAARLLADLAPPAD